MHRSASFGSIGAPPPSFTNRLDVSEAQDKPEYI
jgi:hypothetical protein